MSDLEDRRGYCGEIAEGAVVGGVAGIISGLTFGTAAPALASAGYGVISTGLIAGGASAAAGGLYSGAWYGGRASYSQSGGDLASTIRGTAYGSIKGYYTGLISGAATGGITGRLWSGVVTQGALAEGEAAAIRAGVSVAPRFISPASFAGTPLIGSSRRRCWSSGADWC